MRIAIITRHVPPTRDAVGEYACRLAQALARAGVNPVIVTSAGRVRPVELAGIRVEPVARSWGWIGMVRLLRAIRNLDVEVVNLQYVPHMYGRYGFNLAVAALPFLLKVGARKPVITTCHELLSHYPSGLKGWLMQVVYLVQAWLILSGSARVIVPVEWQERQIHRYFSRLDRKVVRIPAGTNIPEVAPPRHEGEKGDLLTLGTFGTGHPWWQYEMAMEILKKLLTQGIQARLLCIGDIEGSNPEYYRQLRQVEARLGLAGTVEWTGYCPAEKVSHYLHSVDIFLALQRSGVTARSTALIAALAHGLPVVATRGPDADHWLLESGAMVIIDPTDIEKAAREVAQLVEDHQARRDLGRRAREFYQQQLSWETISQQFLDAVASVQTAGGGVGCRQAKV